MLLLALGNLDSVSIRVTLVTFCLRRYSLCGRLTTSAGVRIVVVAFCYDYVCPAKLQKTMIFLLKSRFPIVRPRGRDPLFCHFRSRASFGV